jgi:hypothetical protein
MHVIRNIVIVILHAYISRVNSLTLMEEAKWKQLSNGRRHIGRHLVQKISFAVAPEEEQREFTRTPAEADLTSASDQNTACGLRAEALPVRSHIHKDYNGKVAWVNARWMWITYSLSIIEWYSFTLITINKIGSLARCIISAGFAIEHTNGFYSLKGEFIKIYEV